ncbi:MAG TPA: hypothetical protein DCR21_01840 [Succinivibrionaceae bacterium]|nr:hypothetical protein [Succinivibrionaceae bacterium]
MDELKRNYSIVSLSGKIVDEANSFLKAALVKAGITDILPCHGDILYACFKKPGIKVTEIAKLTHRSKSTVSAMVDKLRALGYLEKLADKNDPRAICIHPSKKALAMSEVFENISSKMNASFENKLSLEEIQTLESLLAKALQSLQKEPD